MSRHISIEKQESRAAMLFIAPFIIGLLIFSIIPIAYSFFISFIDFNNLNGLSKIKFVVFDNYLEVLKDSGLRGSYLKSLYYTLIFVPLITFFGLVMAMALNRKFMMRSVTRTMILMPYVSNTVAIAIVFSVILNPYDGPVNYLLRTLGIANPPMWLAGPETVIPTIALIAVWSNLAFQTIVYFAALQEVPEELYESANIDGANGWQKFTKITLPSVSPTTFFLIVTGIIGSTQNFTIVRALTNGGPGDSSQVAAVSIYQTAFNYNRYSVASAQAILLFVILLVITIIQWKGQKKWVNY